MISADIPKETSSVYDGTLLDEDLVPVPGSIVETLTLTLKDDNTNSVVNGRDAQDVLNTHNVTINESGLVTWLIQPADTTLVNEELPSEVHIAEFKARWSSGTKGCTSWVELKVVNR